MIYHVHRADYKRYDTYGLDDLEPTVRDTTKALRPHLEQFDSIVVIGMSGVLVGAPVALRLKKPLVVLRKKDERSHGGHRDINANRLGKRVLWLDDFEATGDTGDGVKKRVKKLGGQVTHQFMYQSDLTPREVTRRAEPAIAAPVTSILDTDIPF